MSNPFASPFGNQQNAQPVFGGTTNQQNVFGSSPVFGQQSVFGQTSTSTLPNQIAVNSPASLFGPSQTTSGTGLFSNQSASSVTGQSSMFGQSSGQVTSSLFNQPATNEQQGVVFGATGFGISRKPTSTTETAFGSLEQSGTFKSTTKFTPSFSQNAPQSGLFSSTTAAAAPPVFGGARSVTAESGSASTLFGDTGNLKTGVSLASTASLFGNPSSTSVSSSASASLFGRPTVSGSSNLVTTSLFGKPATATGFTQGSESVPVKVERAEDNKPQLFGLGSKANAARLQDTEPVGLFGKAKEEPRAHSFEVKTENSTLFGSERIKQEGQSGASAGKEGGALGAGLFEKGKAERSGAGLFGKGKLHSHSLFGKPMKKEEKSGVGAGNQENEDENPLSVQKGGIASRTAVKGLFGKPAGQDASSAGLFGKPRISRTRLPSSPEDKEEPRSSFHRQISEEINNKVAIVCRNVPHKYNTAIFLRSHFKRFGEVTKVFPNQAKMQAIVHFKTHDSAADAKRRGRILARGVLPMTIFWSSYSGTSASSTKYTKSTTDMEVKSSRPQKRTSDTDLMPKSKKPSWRDSGRVDEELNTMSGTQDIKTGLSTLKGSPEKRSRSVSPTPSTSALDIKPEKIVTNMFEGCVARTVSERVHLLKLRDKYIRQNRTKQKKDLVKAFVGTCPDMCPEKERYDREDKRQLSYYEIIPGTENIPGKNPLVDHNRAVKEYLRSSPDQDEPLPHELRPMPVLLKTMTYLLREIADMGEDGHWADWFDYLWNRTRGIRKDITQQQLNDREAVVLIERCARFHIYSSERLCEEDMHSFDAKINNENLTKCLQTLREFYADLEKKQRGFCENEAEFRAYTVLMNLNEGDILREVQQLRPEIRTSTEIKFALNAYFALNGNNYIKFFRLLKQASFMNACIMHRYFTQIRNKALTLMMRGYSMGNRSAQVPVSELVRLLGFEDENEASDFCQHYGFNVNDGEAVLDRAEYIEPDTAWSPRRSETLIESKLTVSVGELINGGPFTDPVYITPASSFDEDSRFHSQVQLPKKGTVSEGSSLASSSVPSSSGVTHVEVKVAHKPVDTRVDTGRPTGQVDVAREPVAAVPDKPSQMKVSLEYIKELAKVLFWEVIDDICRSVGEEVKSEVDARLLYSQDYFQSLLDTTVDIEIKSLCENVYDEAQADKREALRRELESRRDRVADLLTGDVVNDLVDQEVLNLATIEMRDVKAQLRKECMERVTVDIDDELVEEVMNEMVGEVAEDVFETDVRQRIKQLEDFEKLVKLSRAGRFLHKWKKEYKAVTKLKRAMEEFPCAPNMQNKKEQLKRLLNVEDDRIVDRKFYINKRAKLTIDTPVEIERRRQDTETCALVHRLYRNLLCQTAWTPLDLGRVVGKQLNKNLQRSPQQGTPKPATLYWKLLLCLPAVDESSTKSVSGTATQNLCKWLKVKLSKGPAATSQYDVKGKVLSLYKSHLCLGSTSKPVSVGVCVRSVEGQLKGDDIAAIEEDTLYLGTSALLFVLSAGAPFTRTDSVKYDQYWKAQLARLTAVLEVRPRYQGFPLVVVVPVPANQSISSIQIVRCLSLERLLDEELLSDVELLTYELDDKRPDGIDLVNPKVSEELCESLQWLAKKTKPAPRLTVQYLKDVIDISLQKYYYTPVHLNHKKRKELDRLNKDPNSLLGLYNTVIAHISEVLTSDRLYKVSWPVSEFTSKHNSEMLPNHWNKGDHLEYIFSIVTSLSLPDFIPEHSDSEDWFDVKRDLWQFVHSFAGSDYSGARIKLFTRLKTLLHQLEVDFEEACYFQYGESHCEPTFFNIPWSTVISLCVDYKLDCVDFIDPDSPDPQETKEELKVAYIKDEMDSFLVPDSWKYIEPDQTILECPSLESTIRRVVFRVQDERNRTMTKTEISIAEDPANISVIAKETKKTSSTLMQSLKSERRQSDHFLKYLEDAVQDSDPELDSSISGNASLSVFEPVNQTSLASDFTSCANRRRFSFDPSPGQKSFNATSYFNQTQNNISAIFDQQDEGRSLLPPCRRKSDIGLQELSLLPGKKRRERLSEIYDNDQVMMYLKEPTVTEDLENFRENLKASRRESDLFDKKLQLILAGQQTPDGSSLK